MKTDRVVNPKEVNTLSFLMNWAKIQNMKNTSRRYTTSFCKEWLKYECPIS